MKFGGLRVFHLSCNLSDRVPILVLLSGVNLPSRIFFFFFFGSNRCGSQIPVVRKWWFRLGVMGVKSK